MLDIKRCAGCRAAFKILVKTMLRLATFILAAACLLSVVSCEDERDASALMKEFMDAYSLEGTVYSPAAKEGESGYITEDFFLTMYGEGSESVSDYAVFLLSDLDYVGECAVFICYSSYDAIRVTDMLNRRIDLLLSLGGSADVSFVSDAFILRSGTVVVMGALSDNDRAQRIWRRIV